MTKQNLIPAEKRIFCCIMPVGFSWSDRSRLVNGDYKKLAFMPFSTLDLAIVPNCPADLAAFITADAAKLQARRGEDYQVSTCGQTVKLGHLSPHH